MNAISTLIRSAIDSFRPRMLMLTLASVSMAVLFWLIVLWFSFDFFWSLALSALSSIGFDMTVPAGEEFFLLALLKSILLPMTVFSFLWPVVASSAVLLAGLYVMPPVVKFLANRDYPELQHLGRPNLLSGIWVNLRAVMVFLVAWMLTLPLWLIPGLAFILPVVLTAYLLIAVMRFDALSDHATAKELQVIKSQEGSDSWMIGLVCALCSLVPPLLLIMPVLSALAFTRHYLGRLQALRDSSVIEHHEVK